MLTRGSHDVEPINNIRNDWCDKYDIDSRLHPAAKDDSLNYVEECVNTWHMPDDYKNVDIINYLFDMCETQEQRNRVLIELNLFKDFGMIIVLQFLKYPQMFVKNIILY